MNWTIKKTQHWSRQRGLVCFGFHLFLTFCHLFPGERQKWASPSVPPVQVVSHTDPLQGNLYGTFVTQVTYDKTSAPLSRTTTLSDPPPYQERAPDPQPVESQLALSGPTDDAAVPDNNGVPTEDGDVVALEGELKHRRKRLSTSSS